MKRGRIFRKEAVITYLFIFLILALGIRGLYLMNYSFTGMAIYEPGDVERGVYWNKFYGEGDYNLKIYTAMVNYYNGEEYIPISYGPYEDGFRDANGLIYRKSSDEKYINLYDINDNYISSFGFGITGDVGGVNYRYTTLNFTWTWSQEHNPETGEYIFKAWNNLEDFNWTQEFYFAPNQPMKIKNIIENNLGVSIENTKFWYIQTVGEEEGIWFNEIKYTQDTYLQGEFDSLLPRIKFEDYYIFRYEDLLENGFNITDFYLGDGNVIGVNGVRILAIGITKGDSVFPSGVSVTLDPTIILGTGSGADAYVSKGFPNKNYGDVNELKVQKLEWQRAYLSFNISEIPENQIIDSATLCLYLFNDQGSQTISVNQVYSSWEEMAITWNNQPCGIETELLDSNFCNTTTESNIVTDGALDGTWQCFSVKEMLSKEYGDGNGVLSSVLWTIDGGDADKFYSKEHSDSDLWPYLNVTYHTANSPPIINLTSPQNTLYLSNESLNLNFTVNDADGNLDSCWYFLDSGNNVSLVNCQNTSFDVSSGNHNLVIYANDSLGEEASDSVDFNVDITGVSITISEPSGSKSSRAGIPISLSIVGEDVSCLYNIKTSIGGSVIENTSIECNETSGFDVSNDGDYIFYAYANNSLGNSDSKNSSFSVSTSSSVVISGGGGGGGGSTIPTKDINLFVNEINGVFGSQGDLKKINWKVENIGATFLNDCKFESYGDYASWISYTETRNLAAGEEYEFFFDVKIPESAGGGNYILGVSLTCNEVAKSSNIILEILEKKIGFEFNKVDRISKEKIKITYSLEEFSGINQEVELQFLFFDSRNEKVLEFKENKEINANSKEDFERLISIDKNLEGELRLLVNINSEEYSSFVQESIILSSYGTGLAIFNNPERRDTFFSIFLILIFFVFAFFIIKRILKHKKILGFEKSNIFKKRK